nr:MAG TPA: prohead serine protease [Caudoviricetes sp.]
MIMKSARLEKQTLGEKDLTLINAQTLREFTADEVYTFRLMACDNRVDRDNERFTDQALEQLAALYVGRPVLRDHSWSAGMQTARCYAASVEPDGDAKCLVLRCYMPRTDATADTITAIEAGILRECSVGCAVAHAICSICGVDQRESLCKHYPGVEYDGQVCHFDLDGAVDAYEVSLVAVPAQPAAGAIKSKRYGGNEPRTNPEDAWADEAALEIERNRF